MRKILSVAICLLLLFVGCTNQNKVDENPNVLREVNKVEITYDELVTLINSNDDFIIYIGRPSCGDCQKFNAFLEDTYFVDYPNKGFYYIDTDKIKDAANAENATAEIKNFNENIKEKLTYKWVPTIQHRVNGEIVASFEYLSADFYQVNTDQQSEMLSKANIDFISWMEEHY